MHDILPEQTALWQWLEAEMALQFAAYDFREIRIPLVEQAEVYTRAIGEATDVVEKEMYAFEDRNGDLLCLRPEGTAGVVRAVLQHGLLQVPGLKVWYQGPMFRHERPQRGRQRQFHQFGAEVFGIDSASADAELIAMGQRIWRKLGVDAGLRLEINSLGDRDDRQRYRQALIDYLKPHRERLDEDSCRRLDTNPLRIFDSKVPQTREIMLEAPRLSDFLGEQAREHFAEVTGMLDRLGVAYQLNPGLVRGLDYYNRTVFEWITDDLGAQGTVCAGGRYDGLVSMFGGKPTPGIGFAMGIERLLDLLAALGVERSQTPAVFIVSQLDAGRTLEMAEALRDSLPGIGVSMALSGGSMKSQFKRADRSGARFAVILGESEVAAGQVAVKSLRADDVEQTKVAMDELPGWLARHGLEA